MYLDMYAYMCHIKHRYITTADELQKLKTKHWAI